MSKKILLSLGLVVALVLAIYYRNNLIAFFRTGNTAIGQKVCPDAWYDNRMPPGPSRQYFIVKGKRMEIAELDVNWVRDNCSVNSPQAVY